MYAHAAIVDDTLVRTIGQPPLIISGSAISCAATTATTMARFTADGASQPCAVARGIPTCPRVSPPRWV